MKHLRISLILAVAAVLLVPVLTTAQPKRQAPRACPPFYLRDTMGNTINPLEWAEELKEWKEMMSDMGDGIAVDPNVYGMSIPPYSPRKTCGACHDYKKITSGYHFRMGSDVIHDEFGKDRDEPCSISDGTCGKFSRMYFLQFPPKQFKDSNHIEVGLYQWAARCGTCHPGGGLLEFDRGGHRLDDYRPMGQAGTDGDYYNSHWDLSGVLEADCLMCHMDTYSYQTRYEQVQALNYQWAPTAGALLGIVRGSVAGALIGRASMPIVEYDTSFFQPDGKVRLPIKRPSDRNCLFCHDLSFVEKHGTTFGDTFNRDVHSERGIRCIDCHPGGLHHNFAKGYSHEVTVRDDLDGTGASCEKCHETGNLGAPEMEHEGLPPVHLEKIGCEVCHVPSLRVQAIGMVDASIGRPVTRVSSEGPWFGYREGQTLVPLWYSQVKETIAKILDESTPGEREDLKDEDGDGMPDFNTDDEIKKALETLADDPNLPEGQLVYVRKGQVKTFAQAFQAFLVYELSPSGVLTYDVIYPERPTWRPRYGDVSEWRPVYAPDETGKIRAYNNQTAIWWGQKDGDNIIPLFLREITESIDGAIADQWLAMNPGKPLVDIVPIKLMSDNPTRAPEELIPAAISQLRPAFLDSGKSGEELAKDDDGDGKPEVNTDIEVANFAKILKEQLSGKRFEEVNPVLVSGSRVHEIGEDGTVKSYEHPTAKPVLWSISHSVAPREEALGADGNCEECHSPESYFFYGKAVVDPYDTTVDAKPVKAGMIEMMGYPDVGPDESPVVVRTSQFFKWLTIITMTLLILHILADLIRRALRKSSR
ncbi:MAG: hypothetical protein ABIH23_33900 [bacterium]